MCQQFAEPYCRDKQVIGFTTKKVAVVVVKG